MFAASLTAWIIDLKRVKRCSNTFEEGKWWPPSLNCVDHKNGNTIDVMKHFKIRKVDPKKGLERCAQILRCHKILLNKES